MTALVAHCLDLFASLAPVRARSMMGGHLLYSGALPVALVFDERLYLKVDAATKPAFAAAGGEPFTYELRGRRIEMSYWSPPETALDDAESMTPWAALALEAARRARRAKPRTAGTRGTPAGAAAGARATAGRGTSGSRRRSRGRSRT